MSAATRVKQERAIEETIIANADSDLICSIADCAYKILKGKVRLKPMWRAKVRRYRKQLSTLAKKGTGVACQRANIQTGDFLLALLAP